TQTAGSFRLFFSNPAVGILGSLASILGLMLAVYFYSASRVHRDLVFLAHPTKAVVVRAGQTSRVSVTIDGKPINEDVTAAQVAFWNRGSQSIRSENMLRTLTVNVGRTSQILEARIRKASRDVSEIELDLTDTSRGQLGVRWKILEPGDGAVIQLIFLGG